MIDSSGNIYFATANGTYDGTSNFGDSFIKLTSSLSLTTGLHQLRSGPWRVKISILDRRGLF